MEALTDYTDQNLSPAEWEAWLAAHPELGAEVAAARRARVLLALLQEVSVSVSPDFEARLMARLRSEATLLDLADLGLAGLGQVIVEMLDILFGLFQSAQPSYT